MGSLLKKIALVAALLVVVVGPVLGSRPFASAQDGRDATPGAGGRPGSARVGDAVAYLGADGSELGRLTVTRVFDPFDNFDPASPPPAGQRYVLVALTVENTGQQPLPFDPFALFLRDANGFLYGERTIPRRGDGDAAATPAATPGAAATPGPAGEANGNGAANLPPIAGGDIPPGESRTGVAGFAVPAGAHLTHALFAPAADRLLILAELRPKRRQRDAATPTAG